MVYAEFGGQTECIMGNWKIENRPMCFKGVFKVIPYHRTHIFFDKFSTPRQEPPYLYLGSLMKFTS